VVVVRGSQMALDLVARLVLAPGDVVAVEAWGYRPAWEALARAGAELVPVPVDASGLDISALSRIAAQSKSRVRAVYLTPHHQYPTTVTLGAARRLRLLELARAQRIALIEDDYDHEFHYDGRPVLPLASADSDGTVVYIGTLSKVLAPGVRIGYVVAPAPLVERLAALRQTVDRQGDHAVERAVAELLEDGEVQRHARRARRAYHARRDFLVERLGRELGEVLRFEVPSGGMALWARVDENVNAARWVEQAVAAGVALYPARRFAFDGQARPFLRLGFAALDEKQLADAVRRLRSTMPRP
jgi:GntR family transcriptional regulator/MocR family aminotransferase